MKVALLLLAAIAAVQAKPAINEDMVTLINAANVGWEAHVSPRFADRDMDHVQRLCGAVVDPEVVQVLPAKTDFAPMDLPAEFDSRTQWPNCPSIQLARDQADCGSCWAFGSTEAFNDRLCIASKGAFTTLLSPQDTLSCCGFLNCFSMGCNGGQPGMAWRFFTTTGVVTGGQYSSIGDGKTCLPYQIPQCAHHVDTKKYPACDASHEATAAKCTSTCTETGYGTVYGSDKHKADSSYSVSGVQNIMQEIYTNGPVTGTLTVYEDFPTYKTGVYKHVTGGALGGHAIKIIGWGTENGQDYWLVANSWNETWGDAGFFKIARGSDECGIESGISAGKVSWNTSGFLRATNM